MAYRAIKAIRENDYQDKMAIKAIMALLSFIAFWPF